MGKIKITQTVSRIGSTERQKRNLDALGIKKMGRTVIHEASPIILGMVEKVKHLVKVEATDGETSAAKKAPKTPKVAAAATAKAPKAAAKPTADKATAAKAPKKTTTAKVKETVEAQPEVVVIVTDKIPTTVVEVDEVRIESVKED